MYEGTRRSFAGTLLDLDAPSIKTAQTAARLMRLRQEMTGKAIDADALVQKALAGATAKAMQGVTVNTAGNLGHAVSLTMDTGHSLDFANKRWGIAGINYMSNLVAAGQADVAAILPSLNTYSKSAVVAAKNMSGMALNDKGLTAQLQALAADLNNPFMVHNASSRAMRQAAEARVADLTEAGALPQIAAAQKNVDSARQTALDAQAAYTKAARNAQGARAALMAAQAAFGQNPADIAAMDAVMNAIGSVEDANQAGAQARLAYQSNQKMLIEAQTKLDDVQHKTLASVQAQVKQEIAELRRKQEGAGAALAQRIISSRMMNEMAASARADTKAGPGTGISSRADLPTSPNVSIAENNAGNEAAPLAPMNGSGIIGEGTQRESETGTVRSARDVHVLKTGKDGAIAESVGNDGKDANGSDNSRFSYKHNPSKNPKVLRDADEDTKAIYGYRPSKGGKLKAFADGDWSNPDFVERARQKRMEYHEKVEVGILDLIANMRNHGYSEEQITRAVVEFRNKVRLSSYLDVKGKVIDQKGYDQALAHCKTYEQLIAEGKTNESIMESATRGNPGMDACTGLYDSYYNQYKGEK